MKRKVAIYARVSTEPTTAPTKEGFTFDGWYEYNFEGKKLVIRDINNNVFNLKKNNLKN